MICVTDELYHSGLCASGCRRLCAHGRIPCSAVTEYVRGVNIDTPCCKTAMLAQYACGELEEGRRLVDAKL